MGWFGETQSETEVTKSGRRNHLTQSAVRRRRASKRRRLYKAAALGATAFGLGAYAMHNRPRIENAIGEKYGQLHDRAAPYLGLETRAQKAYNNSFTGRAANAAKGAWGYGTRKFRELNQNLDHASMYPDVGGRRRR